MHRIELGGPPRQSGVRRGQRALARGLLAAMVLAASPAHAALPGGAEPRDDELLWFATLVEPGLSDPGPDPRPDPRPDRLHAPAPATGPDAVGEDPNSGIIVSARAHAPPGDPLERVNVQAFAFTRSADRALVGPLAMAYKQALPEPLRDGLGNALSNLREPAVFLAFLLQARIGKAVETAGRFAINSTLGAAGLFDLARRKPFGLPRRRNGFADTFGFYGLGPGPYLFLPLVGPTTVRDLIGGGLDRLLLPLAVGRPFNRFAYGAVTGTLSALNRRVAIDEQLRGLLATPDPYAALRDAYLRQRQAEIDGLHRHHHEGVHDGHHAAATEATAQR